MLKYYYKNIPNDNSLKSKVMKLAYIGKFALNINGNHSFNTYNSFKQKFQ